jgi:hypothetical protein
MPGEQKWDRSEDSEAAVDKAPWNGKSTDGAGDEGERNDSGASDQADGDHPLVADWVDERTNKYECDH